MLLFQPRSRKTLIFALVILIAACSKKPTEEKKTEGQVKSTSTVGVDNSPTMTSDYLEASDTIPYEELRRRLPGLDLNQDLSNKSVAELRFLRNTIPARYGFLFMSSDLRSYFYHTPWYSSLMKARWYGECQESGLKPAPAIAYTPEEVAFMERVKKLEDKNRSQNYITRNGLRYANVKNIVNTWQYGDRLPNELLKALDVHGFAIVPNKNVQLFHLYEQNNYSRTQNFVTTDLYLQLFHMHYSFMLRNLEENKFVPILGDLLYGITDEVKKLSSSANESGKNALAYNAAFYAIPLTLLGAEDSFVAPSYQQLVNTEMKNIENLSASPSVLLPAYKEFEFPYDLFKPRGHYTRTDTLKRYFKAMQWLQTAPYCLEDETDLSRALTAAYILNTGQSRTGKNLIALYRSILEPTTFLVGKPDNLSLSDLCDIIKKQNINSLAELLKPETMTMVRGEMKKLEVTKNIIKPKIENTCHSKINFMPSRFVLDNEILQEMTNLDSRPYPQGLDVMAAFGSKAAEDILVNELHENKSWKEFLPQLEKLKSKYKNYEAWNETVYAKWINGLNALLKPDKQYPSFMQLPSWNKKNLNTALASWAELKHDAILYTEQPFGAECGDGGECPPPPEPYVVGYVEPNVNYWKSALELLTLTENLLTQHNLMDNSLKSEQSQLRDMCTFLLNISEKELRGEKLSQQEYSSIELIGTHVESLTLSIIGVYDWSFIHGPDKEIAVVADVYTNNQGDKAGILHAAVGYGNDLYVVVEIEGYLYLTKGSTFSYYEFPVPLNQRMTDEEWQERLKKGKVFPVPPWMMEVILKLDDAIQPKVSEYNYSSGC